jgi:gluconokinase
VTHALQLGVKTMSTPSPRLSATVILMGVSGSGKTRVGQELARRVGGSFADADDFHAEVARGKMQAGVPLTDEDRWPWLERLRAHLLAERGAGRTLVLACSALKQVYRERLRGEDAAGELAFVYLHGSAELIRSRMAARQGHYMPVSLLESQLATLEVPVDALQVSIDATPEQMVDCILEGLALP